MLDVTKFTALAFFAVSCGSSSHPPSSGDAGRDAASDPDAGADAVRDAGRDRPRRCAGDTLEQWNPRTSAWEVVADCRGASGFCVDGECHDACDVPVAEGASVACGHWAVDLDNASIAEGLDASAQPFGVTVANPGDAGVHVVVEVNHGQPGASLDLEVVAEADVEAGGARAFDLGRRELDGTAEGAFDYELADLSGSFLSSNAFRITSDGPITVSQWNPLTSADAFSADASVLLPTSAQRGPYVVLSWPQTIADTDHHATDSGVHLKTFLTIVGTTPDTLVEIDLSTDTVGGTGTPARSAGDRFDVTLGPFDVLNLETAGFLADFTGTVVDANAPVAVFAGSESSDVPLFRSLDERLCCASHLEEQVPPVAAQGRRYVAVPLPQRSQSLLAAGSGLLPEVLEESIFRLLAIEPGVTSVTVGLPEHQGRPIDLDALEHIDVVTIDPFVISSNRRISVGQLAVGQSAAGVPTGLPGGDPSFALVPSVEQFRSDYFFTIPTGYGFDFLLLAGPPESEIELDGGPLPDSCEVLVVDAETVVHRCAVSSPRLAPPAGGAAPWTLAPGVQADGPHRIKAREPVGLMLYGFDFSVSYLLPGGASLRRPE